MKSNPFFVELKAFGKTDDEIKKINKSIEVPKSETKLNKNKRYKKRKKK